MGSHDVLVKFVPSADFVASRQGSPADRAEDNLSAPRPGQRGGAVVRTVAIGEEQVGDVHEPTVIRGVRGVDIRSLWAVRELLREVVCALPLSNRIGSVMPK